MDTARLRETGSSQSKPVGIRITASSCSCVASALFGTSVFAVDMPSGFDAVAQNPALPLIVKQIAPEQSTLDQSKMEDKPVGAAVSVVADLQFSILFTTGDVVFSQAVYEKIG